MKYCKFLLKRSSSCLGRCWSWFADLKCLNSHKIIHLMSPCRKLRWNDVILADQSHIPFFNDSALNFRSKWILLSNWWNGTEATAVFILEINIFTHLPFGTAQNCTRPAGKFQPIRRIREIAFMFSLLNNPCMIAIFQRIYHRFFGIFVKKCCQLLCDKKTQKLLSILSSWMFCAV